MIGNVRAFARCVQFHVSRYSTPCQAAIAICNASASAFRGSAADDMSASARTRISGSTANNGKSSICKSRSCASMESPRQASSMTYCDVTRVYFLRSSDAPKVRGTWVEVIRGAVGGRRVCKGLTMCPALKPGGLAENSRRQANAPPPEISSKCDSTPNGGGRKRDSAGESKSGTSFGVRWALCVAVPVVARAYHRLFSGTPFGVRDALCDAIPVVTRAYHRLFSGTPFGVRARRLDRPDHGRNRYHPSVSFAVSAILPGRCVPPCVLKTRGVIDASKTVGSVCGASGVCMCEARQRNLCDSVA